MQRNPEPSRRSPRQSTAPLAALRWLPVALAACASPGAPRDGAMALDRPSERGVQGAPARQDDLAALQAMLATGGPDGREARETAVERLLAAARPEAHALLWRALGGDDRDGVPMLVATSLQRHLQLAPAQQFGGMTADGRAAVAKGWLAALLSPWRADAPPSPEAFGAAARGALQRWPARELDAAARAILAGDDAAARLAVLRCLADLQQTYYAATLAERIEDADMALRAAAQEALQLLTCHEEPIRTRAAFAQWQERFGAMRYVDLAERAARRSTEPLERAKAAMAALRVDAAREVVRAHVVRTPGIDWQAVQARVVDDDPAVLDAGLEVLVQALPGAADDASPARAAFARALLQRARAEPVERAPRRARLFEAAAYLARPDDAELAGELVAALLAQLDTGDKDVQVSALRGLRRFPSPETRARLVALAHRLLAELPAARDQVAAILAALGARATPRWPAPSPNDADKAEWLRLVAAACRSDEALDLRQSAVALAQSLDAREQRLPEAFQLLLDLVRDESLTVKFRSNCALLLQDWRADAAFAGAWLAAQHALLRDAMPELRLQAAEALASLAEANDAGREESVGATIAVVRERLLVEPDAAVLRALATMLQECARVPGMLERALGALRLALQELGMPVAAEHQFRVDPLLQALATIAADARAEQGQWLAACPTLLAHRRRQSLRLILQNHGASALAKDVASGPAATAARDAMSLVLETAALKPPREAWTSSEDLRREAQDVDRAFLAFDALPEKERPDRGYHRLLRLAVEIAVDRPQSVVQRATAWLAAGGGANGATGSPAGAAPARSELTDAERDRMRLLAAEASLAARKPETAKKFLDERTGDDGEDAATVRDLESRIGRELVAIDLKGAVALFDRVLRRTAPEDPAFRARLYDWAACRIQLDPSLRENTRETLLAHAALLAAADTSTELKELFAQLQSPR